MWKVTDTTTGQPEAMEGVQTDGVGVNWDVSVRTIKGAERLSRETRPERVYVELRQAAGDNWQLLEMSKRNAGIKLKLTLEVMIEGDDGNTEPEDVLDVNFQDLVPDSFQVQDESVVLRLATETPPVFKPIGAN